MKRVCLLMMGLCSGLAASAATYYIAPTVPPAGVTHDAVDDAEHGTLEKPFATLAYAAGKMGGGTPSAPVEFVLLKGTHQITSRVVYANKGCTRLMGETTNPADTVVDFGDSITGASLVTIDAQLLNMTFTHASPTDGNQENCASIRLTGGISNDNYALASNCVFTANTANTPLTLHSRVKVIDCVFSDNQTTGRASCIRTFNKNTVGLGDIVITGCRFERNSANYNGALIDCDQQGDIAAHVITDCQFVANTNLTAAGLIATRTGTRALLEDCTFTENQGALSGTSWGGTALFGNEDSFLAATNCTFTSNKTVRYGGAATFYRGSFSISGCTFTANDSASAGTLDGGAIYAAGATGEIVDSTFTANTCNYRGAAVAVVDNSLSGVVKKSAVTITGCTFDANVAAGNAGAILLMEAQATLKNNTFTNNVANGARAGAVYFANNTTAVVDSCTFVGNTSSFGAAMYWVASAGTVSNSLFASNVATQAGGATGLAVSIGESMTRTAQVDFFNCMFDGNRAPNGGRAAVNLTEGSKAALVGCTFKNHVTSQDGAAIRPGYQSLLAVTNGLFVANSAPNGGALYLPSETTNSLTRAEIVGSTFIDNVATVANQTQQGGGAICLPDQYSTQCLLVDRCVFSNNTTRSTGGAIYMRSGTSAASDPTIHIRNSLFVNNSAAKNGGGINLVAGNARVENCTFVGNTAEAGNNIYHRWPSPVVNTIIVGTKAEAGNFATAGDATVAGPMYVNCIQCGPADSTTEGKFKAANGCTNITDVAEIKFVDAASGNYAIQSGSLARDKGRVRDWMDGALDLAGNKRIFVKKAGTTGVPDIGAYEFVSWGTTFFFR